MALNKRAIATQSEGNNTFLGYMIAGITLGAAIGNMFMAGKIRNVMKMNIPNPARWKEEVRYKQPEPHSREEFTAQQAESFGGTRNIGIPDDIVNHLKFLKLPAQKVSEVEIKDAYRKAVLKYHPDRMQLKDAAMKPAYESKFKQSTESYQALIQHFVKGKT